MQWANSAKTLQGETKVLYNPITEMFDKIVADRSCDGGYRVYKSAKDVTEISKEIQEFYKEGFYENNRTKQGTREGVYKSVDEYERQSRGSDDDLHRTYHERTNGSTRGLDKGKSDIKRIGHTQTSGQNSQISDTGTTDDSDKKSYALPENFTPTKADSAYLKALNDGDFAAAQVAVKEAAEKAGYTIRAYHGTNSSFTVFDKIKNGSNTGNIGMLGNGFYFTNSKKLADNYNRKNGDVAKDGNGTTLETYLSIKNPLIKAIKREVNNGTYQHAKTIDEWARVVRSGKGSYDRNSYQSSERRGNERTHELHGGESARSFFGF